MKLRSRSVRCAFLVVFFMAALLFSVGSAVAITGYGPVAEFKIASPAQFKGIIHAKFITVPTYMGQMDVDGVTGTGMGLSCAGISQAWPTSRKEIADAMVNLIMTDSHYMSMFNSNTFNPMGTLDQMSTVCVMAKAPPAISTWEVYVSSCGTPCGVNLMNVGTGSSCISPLRILPLIEFAAPKLELRGVPTTRNAHVNVQASFGGASGPQVDVTILAGKPLDDEGEDPNEPMSVGGRVTKALLEAGYMANNLHLQDSLRDDGKSLFIEISQVGGKVPDRIDLFIYHSNPLVPDPVDPAPEVDVGSPLSYGVQWENVKGPLFHRGDADGNGTLQLTDAIRILNVLFLGIGQIDCMDAADSDDNGILGLTDAVRILNVLFLGIGSIPDPFAPGPAFGDHPCGRDPGPESIGCDRYDKCGG